MRALVLILCVFIAGCGTARKESRRAHLAGGWDGRDSASRIREGLTRGANEWGHFYVEARLMSMPYILADTYERAMRKRLDPLEGARMQGRALAEMTAGKTCFIVNVATHSQHASDTQFWFGRVRDASGKEYPLKFQPATGMDSVASIAPLKGYKWSNTTGACTDRPVDVKDGFSVMVGNHFLVDAPSTDLFWDVSSR